MEEFDKLLAILEKEIKNQRYLLEDYISQGNFGKANGQQGYISGLEKAMLLVQGEYLATRVMTRILENEFAKITDKARSSKG